MTHGKEIPMFMTSRKYLAVSVLFVIAFSVFFMVIYTPFSVSSWFSIKDMGSFGISVVFTVAAIAILAVSKTAIYLLRNRICFTAARYIAWLMCENIVISLGYTILTFQLLPGITSSSIPSIAVRVLFFVTMITAIPYSLVTLYVAYRTKSEELEAALDERDRLRGELQSGQSCGRDGGSGSAATAADDKSIRQQRHAAPYHHGRLALLPRIAGQLCKGALQAQRQVLGIYAPQPHIPRSRESLAGTGMIRYHRSYI